LKTKQKIYAIFLLSLLIGITFYTGYTLAQSGNTFIISEGIYPQATYTIWEEGSTYYAKNIYGAIDYSGTNATTVSNNAYSQLTNGGTVVFAQGTYIISGQIEPTNNTVTYGYGAKFVKQATSEYTVNLLNSYNVTIQGLEVDGQNIADRHLIVAFPAGNHLTFRDLWLYGATTKPTGAGLWIGGALGGISEGDVLIDNVRVEYTEGHCISLKRISHVRVVNSFLSNQEPHTPLGTGYGGVTLENVTDAIIANNNLENNGEVGAYLASYTANVCISNNVIRGNNYGIRLSGGNHYDTSITGNVIVDNLEQGIRVSGQFNGLSVTGNTIVYSGTDGIYLKNYGNGSSVISGNSITFNGDNGIYIDHAHYLTISGNTILHNDRNDTGNSGIYLVNSKYSVISTSVISDIDENTQDWGIYYYSGDRNLILGISAIGNTIGGIFINATVTNTEIHSCWNHTSWIT